MEPERDPDVRPTWSETGLPLCDDACPNFDGKRCKAMGHRPDRFCEPELVHQAQLAAYVTGERDRQRTELALIAKEQCAFTGSYENCEEAMGNHEPGDWCAGCIARRALAGDDAGKGTR